MMMPFETAASRPPQGEPPITGLLGLIDKIKDRYPKDPNTQHDTDRLNKATASLLRLLNEIIDIVDLESGEMKETPETFSLFDMIEHNLQLQLPRAEHKGIAVKVKINPTVPRALFGPRVYLDRILLNLLSNAIKFTDQGDVMLSVSATPEKDNKIQLNIMVEDSGIGIPEDQFETIFEHFSRLEPAYKSTYEGSGLGLYTVKRYIDALGGTIDVSSQINIGSCFTVTVFFQVGNNINLPEAEKNKSIDDIQALLQHTTCTKLSNQTTLQKQVPTPPTPLSATESNATILIVEDQELAKDTFEIQLHKQGIVHILWAGDAKTAFALIEKNHIDLIFMDIGLPDMTGIELTQQIRQHPNPQKANLPIIALTGHAKKQIETDCHKAGMQGAYTKPISHSELIEVLQRYLPSDNTSPTQQDTETTENPSRRIKEIQQVPSIDLDAATACIGALEDATRILKKYLHTLDQVQNELETAFVNHDQQALRELLHGQRGTLSMLGGLPRLHALVNALHQALKNQQPQQINSYYSALLMEIQELQKKNNAI